MTTDPDLIEPAPMHLPGQLWQPWTMIVPALLLIPLLALAYSWQISPTSDAILLQKRHRVATPQPTEQPGEDALPHPASQIHIFTPGAGEMLHENTVPEVSTPRDHTPEDVFTSHGTAALTGENVFRR